MTEKQTYLVATRGFSANGVSMQAGEYLTDQFDTQTVKVLKGMGRLEETEIAPGEADPVDVVDAGKPAKNRAVGLPGGLPGAPVE